MTIDIELKDSSLDRKPKVPKSLKRDNHKPKKDLSVPPKTSEQKKRKITIGLIVITILTLVIGFLIYKGYIFSHNFGFRFRPGSLISKEEKTLKKDSSGNFTNALLVGLDTRENGGLLNTDTLILASYNHKTNDLTLLSIPRDFHVEIQNGMNWYGRINSLYNIAEQEEEGSGINELRKSVEEVTGQEIQYYAIVDFKAFTEIIDTVGGIDINVENSFTDYRYPLGIGYQTVSFTAGPQTMDGETALIFSRSRHSLQNNEGSDFARARRQQKVILALKDKLLSSESLTKPKTLVGIFSSIAGNVRISEFTMEDIEAGLELAKKFEEKGGDVFSFVLDPTIGNYELVEKVPLESGAYAIGPKLGLGDYDDIHEYLQLMTKNPKLYTENAKIFVYDTGAGFQTAQNMTKDLQEAFPYIDITFAGTLRSDQEEIVVYSQTDEGEENNYTETVSKLKRFLNTELTQQPEYITTNLNGEDVTILLGKSVELKEE